MDDIFGGSIPRQFIPAVEKGIQDARTRGYLAGYPMVDFRVTVFDGSYHDVDSNELSFKLAGSLAFKDAMTRARPTILEPIMNVEVYAPSDFAGDLMGDLNGRRGRIGGMDTRGVMTIIKAQVPMAEMLTYEQHLTSATGGRGSYHMEYSHYDEVPSHLQTKIIAAHEGRASGCGGGRSLAIYLVPRSILLFRVSRFFAPFAVAFRLGVAFVGCFLGRGARFGRLGTGARRARDALRSSASTLQPAASASAFARGLNSLPTSSTCATSALSPLRKPSRSSRVYPPGRDANRGASVSNSFVTTSRSCRSCMTSRRAFSA